MARFDLATKQNYTPIAFRKEAEGGGPYATPSTHTHTDGRLRHRLVHANKTHSRCTLAAQNRVILSEGKKWAPSAYEYYISQLY